MSAKSRELSINTLRFLAVDAVEKANSGHPGMPMGAAATAFALWTDHLKFDPDAPAWPDRDRFVLSAGHGSMLLYALLHLSGFALPLEEIRNFRQWGSMTPGHPEFGHTPGVETTTGPLGQGIAAAVGMALAEAHLAARFNKPGHTIVDHRTFALAGDGCLMEGVSAEAASLAGHLKLGKLVVLYDDNHITIEGSTDLAFSEDVGKRFEAYGWRVLTVADGNDADAVSKAITEAGKKSDKPTLIKIRTNIGFGSPKKQDKAAAHGSPLGKDEVAATKNNLCWDCAEPFHISKEALAPFKNAATRGKKTHEAWVKAFKAYGKKYPELAAEFARALNGELPEDFAKLVPAFHADAKGMATRVASGKAINAIAKGMPELIGGSADLAPSNNSYIDGEKDFQPTTPEGRNLRFGVREFGMAAVANGIANHGGLRPYVATFFVFTDYMRAAVRLSALMGVPVVYVMTHDSIHVGEDGPTHQPVEHLASLRAMPGLSIIRPADANETAEAWAMALENQCQPTMLVLTRQNVPTLERKGLGAAKEIRRGGFIMREAKGKAPKAIIIATGSEVHTALKAADMLEAKKIPTRVVNLASWDVFEKQPKTYRNKVLPPELTARVSVEAGATFGWERYVGFNGKAVGFDRFGASAPGEVVAKELGVTAEDVVKAVKSVLK